MFSDFFKNLCSFLEITTKIMFFKTLNKTNYIKIVNNLPPNLAIIIALTLSNIDSI